MYAIIFILLVILIAIGIVFTTNGKTSNSEKSNKEIAEIASERDLSRKGLAFRLVNHGPKDLEIWIENSPDEELKYLVTIPASDDVFVYPKNQKLFVPGTTFFSKFEEDPEGTFVYQPYVLKDVDDTIHFGEVSTDVLRSDPTTSDRNEILSLNIENRSLKPYHVFYRGDYLGCVGAYHPTKKSISYSILTNNRRKHFQLGTWLEFRMEGTNHSQFIQLTKKIVTDVYLGTVIGRTIGGC